MRQRYTLPRDEGGRNDAKTALHGGDYHRARRARRAARWLASEDASTPNYARATPRHLVTPLPEHAMRNTVNYGQNALSRPAGPGRPVKKFLQLGPMRLGHSNTAARRETQRAVLRREERPGRSKQVDNRGD